MNYKIVLFLTLSLVLTLNPDLVSGRKRKGGYDDDYYYDDEYEDKTQRRDSVDSLDERQDYSHGNNVDFLAPLVLLAPLAGLAALYTAAAVNQNSALISIAVLNNGGRRKRRSLNEIDLSPQMQYLTHTKSNLTELSYKMMHEYISYSGMGKQECLLKVGCEIARQKHSGVIYQEQTMSQLLSQLLKNPFMTAKEKEEILMGVGRGTNGDCSRIKC